MASRNIEKTKARLQERIQHGDFYEAHQQLRVLSQRYLRSNNYDAAIDVLCTGIQALLKSGQMSSAADLCLLLVDVHKAGKRQPTASSKSRLLDFVIQLPHEEPTRKRFINESVDWTSKFGDYPAGDPEFHHSIGSLYLQEDDVVEAEKHLIVGNKDSPVLLVQGLYEWYKQDEPHKAPFYAARAAMAYLMIGNLRDAARSLALFTDHLCRESKGVLVQEVQSNVYDIKVFPSLPLLNFMQLLVLAIQRGGPDLFNSLTSHYGLALKEVPEWDEILPQLGEMYFGIKPKRGASLLDMVGGLFGGTTNSAHSQLPNEVGLD